jgi:hypothetical protein
MSVADAREIVEHPPYDDDDDDDGDDDDDDDDDDEFPHFCSVKEAEKRRNLVAIDNKN